jgi:hypothetical protein
MLHYAYIACVVYLEFIVGRCLRQCAIQDVTLADQYRLSRRTFGVKRSRLIGRGHFFF